MQLRPIAFAQASLAGLIVAASGSSSLALTEAATSQNQQPQPSPTLIAKNTTTGNACDLDTRLAARVVRNTLLDSTYNTRSRLIIEGSAPGIQVNLDVQVMTLSQAPGQFRSEIVFKEINSTHPLEYLITSNGEQAWIYDKLNDRYSTMSYEEFDDSDDSFLMGMVANLGLMLQSGSDNIGLMSELSEAELALVLTETIAPCQESGLNVELRNMNGQNYQTFSFEDETEGFTMAGFMNRQTGQLDFFHLSGNEDGIDFTLKEQIIHRTAIPEVASTTFEFIPPATAQESEEPISISPFSTTSSVFP